MKRIKDLRNRYKITVRKLAECLNTNYAYLNKLVNYDYLTGKSDTGFIVTYETNDGESGGSVISENELDDYLYKGWAREYVDSTGVYHQVFGHGAKIIADRTFDELKSEDKHISRYRTLKEENKKTVNDLIDYLTEKESKGD